MTDSPDLNAPAAALAPPAAPAPTPPSPPAAPAAPPPAADGARQRGIRFNDRVLALGPTGSGKSVLLNMLLWTAYRCQRVLLDTKDEFSIPGVEPVSKIAAIDWAQPLIHYVDDRGSLKEYDDLFRVFLQRKSGRQRAGAYGLVVCVHELADLCGDAPGATPQFVSAYIRKGRAHGLGLLGGSQRPVNMPKAARTEAQHVFAFAPGFDPDDQQVVARLMRMTVDELGGLLGQAPEHSYLWFDQRAQPPTVMRPPLPASQIARCAIRGLDPTPGPRR